MNVSINSPAYVLPQLLLNLGPLDVVLSPVLFSVREGL